MRNLFKPILPLLFILSIGCYQDSEVFIPDEHEGPLQSMAEFIPNTSQVLTLDNADHNGR